MVTMVCSPSVGDDGGGGGGAAAGSYKATDSTEEGVDAPTPAVARAIEIATAAGIGTVPIKEALGRITVIVFCCSVFLFHLGEMR